MGSGVTSPERQQEILKILFDRKITKVKSEDNLQIEVKERLFGVEYRKENLQGNVKVEVRKIDNHNCHDLYFQFDLAMYSFILITALICFVLQFVNLGPFCT